MAVPPCGAFKGRPGMDSTVSLYWAPPINVSVAAVQVPLAPALAAVGRALEDGYRALGLVGAEEATHLTTTLEYRDTMGCTFRQLYQEVPVLAPLYTPFETTFNAHVYSAFAERYMAAAFLICSVYLAFLYFGTKVMANRPRFELRTALRYWNLGLAIFSAIGFLRTAPHLLYFLFKDGVWDMKENFFLSVCKPGEPSYGHGASGLWVMLFIFSKVPELFDTVFIVLRKQSLIFLHWYHHVTVLLYCWHSYATRSSAGLYFVSMNFGVHALMYYYYYLVASRDRSKEAAGKAKATPKWDGIVTTLQISQMFVGMFICGAVYYFEEVEGRFCDVRLDNYVAGLVMYASYAALFILFAVGRYCGKDLISTGGKPKAAAAAAGTAGEAAGTKTKGE